MPSLIGILFFLLSLIFSLSKRELLLPLLLFSSIFQAASVINSTSLGVPPYYVVAVFFIFSTIVFNGRSFFFLHRSEFWLIGFAIYCLWISIFGPFMFAGLPIYDPSIGLDDNFVMGPSPLHFSIRNVAQSVYLVINVLIVLCAARTRISASIRRSWSVVFWFLASMICLQSLLVLLGIPFPWHVINNNQTYQVTDPSLFLRPTGTYSEPSYAGAAVASFGASFLFEFLSGTGSGLAVLLCIGMLLALGSTSALGAWLLIALIVFLRFRVIRLPWYVNLTRVRKYAVLLLPALIGFLGALASPFGQVLLDQTFNKGSSWSYLARTGADRYAATVFIKTDGLGAGLGSNRPSSFIVSVLSSIGLVGLLLLAIFIYTQIRKLSPRQSWLVYALIGLLATMCLGIPDINFPGFWILIALLSNASHWGEPETRLQNQHPTQPAADTVFQWTPDQIA